MDKVTRRATSPRNPGDLAARPAPRLASLDPRLFEVAIRILVLTGLWLLVMLAAQLWSHIGA